MTIGALTERGLWMYIAKELKVSLLIHNFERLTSGDKFHGNYITVRRRFSIVTLAYGMYNSIARQTNERCRYWLISTCQFSCSKRWKAESEEQTPCWHCTFNGALSFGGTSRGCGSSHTNWSHGYTYWSTSCLDTHLGIGGMGNTQVWNGSRQIRSFSLVPIPNYRIRRS